MSSGGGGSNTATTYTSGPAWLQPYAGAYMKSLYGNVQQNLNQGPPSALFSQVAPFTPFQNAGLGFAGSALQGLYPYGQTAGNLAMGATPQATGLANTGASTLTNFATGGINSPLNSTISDFASGKYLNPNPYMNAYYNAAAMPMVSNYMYGTQPSLQAQFEQAGAFNSPGFSQAQGLAQQNLAQGLGTLGANIAYPAYQQGMEQMLQAGGMAQQNSQFNVGNQLQAAGMIPNMIGAMYQPAYNLAGMGSNLLGLFGGIGQGLYGAGSAQQQQMQNILNAGQSNAAMGVNWPFAMLGQLGAALGTAGMGGGMSRSFGSSGGGGLFGL